MPIPAVSHRPSCVRCMVTAESRTCTVSRNGSKDSHSPTAAPPSPAALSLHIVCLLAPRASLKGFLRLLTGSWPIIKCHDLPAHMLKQPVRAYRIAMHESSSRLVTAGRVWPCIHLFRGLVDRRHRHKCQRFESDTARRNPQCFTTGGRILCWPMICSELKEHMKELIPFNSPILILPCLFLRRSR